MTAIVVFLMLLDAISPMVALGFVIFLVRRQWRVPRAYFLCSLLWVVHANVTAHLVGFNPSAQMVIWIGWACDTLLLWHDHDELFQNGHTKAEYDILMVTLPIFSIVVVATLLLKLIDTLWAGKNRTFNA